MLTATYADSAIVGSLGFVAVTDGAAVPSTTNETMQIQCDSLGTLAGPGTGPFVTSAAASVPVTSSTLALDGDHVVLGFAGSGCGESFSVSVLCTAGDGGVWGGAWGHAAADDGGASDGPVPTEDSAVATWEGGTVADGGL